MKANYNRKQVDVNALVTSFNKINILLYNQTFGRKYRACQSYIELINQLAKDFDERYEGYGHEKALAESLKKQGITIRLASYPLPLYQAYREVIRFYLNLTAKALLRRRVTREEIENYIKNFQKILASKNWTEGKAVRELDEMLLKNVNLIFVNGIIEECEV